MKKDLEGFWGRLPPEAQRLVESLDQGSRRQERRVATRQQAGGDGFSSFEQMIMGEGAPEEIQEDDRMFDPPAPEPVRESAPARKGGRKSLRSLIESMERK